jgi:hypothetical protein
MREAAGGNKCSRPLNEEPGDDSGRIVIEFAANRVRRLT